MRVELSDEQEFLREAVAGVLAREASPAHLRSWTATGDSGPADALAAHQGWTGIGLDEEQGGQGGGAVELMIVAEELGRAGAPWDRLLGGSLALQLLACVPHADPALLSETAEGETPAVLLLDGRCPPVAWPVEVLAGDALTLSADYVPGAATASRLLVAVDAGSGDGGRLMTVDAGSPSVSITPRELVDRTRSLARVELAGAPAVDLGEVSSAAFAQTASLAAVLVAADALGAAARMLELTTAYVTDRRQFGVPVGSFQAVKHAAAEMQVDVEASRSAVRYAAWAVAARADDAPVWAAIAKSFVGTAAARVADRALFLHGAIGYTWEHDLQFFFKRAKSDALLFGSADAHRDLIAGQLELTAMPIAVSEGTG